MEAAAAFTSVITGGATNTASAEPLNGGLINQIVTSTGEKQTLSFNINEQIDFNAGDTQGLAASASAATYGLDVNLIDSSLLKCWNCFLRICFKLIFK